MRFADKRSRNAQCRDRLAQRRKVVMRTLEYLYAERKSAQTNQTWKTAVTQRKRLNLLDEIYGWYDAELKEIDTVLDSLDEPCTKQSRIADQ